MTLEPFFLILATLLIIIGKEYSYLINLT